MGALEDHGQQWDELASRPRPSWYLDRLVALQKRGEHRRLFQRWLRDFSPHRALKTDLFEEANGADQILFDLLPQAPRVYGMDVSAGTAAGARRRCPRERVKFLVADVRRLPFPSESFDLIVSTSTLDHFERRDELLASLRELARILRPGGRLVITLDNERNPFYSLLRWTTRRGWAPFVLGHSMDAPTLEKQLTQCGLRLQASDVVIHNPRLFSTLLFLALRRGLGRHADAPIRGLLRIFSWLDRLPTRSITACFVAACAEKPVAPRHETSSPRPENAGRTHARAAAR